MPPPLRELLQQARPSWTEEDLDAVEFRLAQVDIKNTEALAAALRKQLNERLRRAGLKTFAAETVRDLRHALGLKCRPRSTVEVLEEPSVEERQPSPEERQVSGPQEARTAEVQAGVAAQASEETTATAAEPRRERRSWREALSQARAAQEEVSTKPLGHTEIKEEPKPSREADLTEVKQHRPAWMKALQKAKDPGGSNLTVKDGLTVNGQKLQDTTQLNGKTFAAEEATGSTAGTEDDACSSGSDVIDLPPASARQVEEVKKTPPHTAWATPANAPKPEVRPAPDQLPRVSAKAPARPFKSALASVRDAKPKNGGDHDMDGMPTAHVEAADGKPEGDLSYWFEKGRRFREQLKAAREAAVAAESGGSAEPEPAAGEGAEEGGMLCSGCGLWPATSDPVDDGEGGYCDNCWFNWEGPLQTPPVPKRHQVLLVRTAKDQGLRLSKLPPLALKTARPGPGDVTVVLDPSTKYQTIMGFGGAFTESSAKVFQKLSPENQERVLDAYFHEERGLGYSFGRLHMTSCDFSDGNWTCCDKPYDEALETFSIERFQEAILPMVRRAQETRGGKSLMLLASPWSPPAWMKASNDMCKRGDKLLPEFRDAWARYFVRFAEELEKEGFLLWGFTVQNEPENKDVAWETCIVTPEEERDFVKYHLGPALAAAGLAGNPRIIVWDHNRSGMITRARAIYEDPDAASFVWGMGFHWYGEVDYKSVQHVHDMFPDKHLVFTEGCEEGDAFLGDWRLGEVYGVNILEDLNHWTEAWIDWNLVLNENGGPNHAGNYCSAPVIADTQRDCVMFQPSWYYIGHFSRHVRPGAVRISCVIRGLGGYEEFYASAFLNTDGTIVLIALNIGDQNVDFTLCLGGSAAWASAPEHSITTFTLLDAPHPSPVHLGSSGDSATGPPAEREKYCIAGSWDDWKGLHDMAWDEEGRCYRYRVQLPASGIVSFQIVLGGHWKTTLYPHEDEGCHHSGSMLCGPDDRGHHKNWTIGRHPLDHAQEGARYDVRLFMGLDGRAERVDWLPLGVAAGFG